MTTEETLIRALADVDYPSLPDEKWDEKMEGSGEWGFRPRAMRGKGKKREKKRDELE